MFFLKKINCRIQLSADRKPAVLFLKRVPLQKWLNSQYTGHQIWRVYWFPLNNQQAFFPFPFLFRILWLDIFKCREENQASKVLFLMVSNNMSILETEAHVDSRIGLAWRKSLIFCNTSLLLQVEHRYPFLTIPCGYPCWHSWWNDVHQVRKSWMSLNNTVSLYLFVNVNFRHFQRPNIGPFWSRHSSKLLMNKHNLPSLFLFTYKWFGTLKCFERKQSVQGKLIPWCGSQESQSSTKQQQLAGSFSLLSLESS